MIVSCMTLRGNRLRFHTYCSRLVGATCALTATLALTIFPHQAQSQSICSNIENDIERLACFDAEFPAQSASNSDPLQIFERFRDLIRSTPDLSGNYEQIVTFNRDYLDIITYGDGCSMGILHIAPATGRRGSDAFGVTRLLGYEYTFHEIDVTKVADVQLAMNPGEMSVAMTKGSEIPRYTFRVNPNSDFNTDMNSQLLVFNSQGGLVPDMQRTQRLRIVVEAEDTTEALTLFSSLVSACQTN